MHLFWGSSRRVNSTLWYERAGVPERCAVTLALGARAGSARCGRTRSPPSTGSWNSAARDASPPGSRPTCGAPRTCASSSTASCSARAAARSCRRPASLLLPAGGAFRRAGGWCLPWWTTCSRSRSLFWSYGSVSGPLRGGPTTHRVPGDAGIGRAHATVGSLQEPVVYPHVENFASPSSNWNLHRRRAGRSPCDEVEREEPPSRGSPMARTSPPGSRAGQTRRSFGPRLHGAVVAAVAGGRTSGCFFGDKPRARTAAPSRALENRRRPDARR